MSNEKKLFDTVVAGGYCVGCGACAAVEGSPLVVRMNKYGQYQATLESNDSSINNVAAVCPFSDESTNEDTLGKRLFGAQSSYHNKMGYHLKAYAGFVAEGQFREKGSSGGMGTWVVHELLDKGIIDAVIHVRERNSFDSDEPMFGFGVTFSTEEVRQGAKSRYYPIEMSSVLNFVKSNPGLYAFVGIPCFVKAVRLLADQNPIIKERVKFCVGLVCGHLKSSRFAEQFAWQGGVSPWELTTIDFRKKIAGQGADLYGVEVIGFKNGQVVKFERTNKDFYGHNWGHGFFKYQACDYCDDVLAETADIAVGDAWLPAYVDDDKGTNIVVVRNPVIANLIEKAQAEGRLQMEVLSPADIVRSQDAGFRHRREGLSYRLFLADQNKKWRPVKRVAAGYKHLDARTRRVQERRLRLAAQSHEAFYRAREENNYSVFKDAMDPLLDEYVRCSRISLLTRIKRKIKKLFWTELFSSH